MIEIFDYTLLKTLIILLENSVKCSYYLDIWKRSNVIPVRIKCDKPFVKNYGPISFLPIF